MGRIKRAKEFLTTGVWKLDREELSAKKARLVRYLQVVLLTFRDVSNQKIGLRAVSLAFFSTMALIPCVALAFAVTNGFGLADKLGELLLSSFPGNEGMVQYIMTYAYNIVGIASNGWFGVITFLSFIWLVFWLMIQVENAFNYVWEAERNRSLWKRISVYFGIIILLPFILIMFMAIILQFNNGGGLASLIHIPFWEKISGWVSWLIIYGLTVVVLSLMYKFIPSPKVKYAKAFQSSLFTGAVFCLFQWFYVVAQVAFNRWNTVFGAVAAIPFLMVWLNISWQIILIGSELAFAFQHVDEYKLDQHGKLFADRRTDKTLR